MKVIGLTGGIACGKSTISLTLKELGAVIVDGDVLSRTLTCPGGAALPAIRSRFGDGVFHPDGTLNRRALADVIFHDDRARAALDGIMQPLLMDLILQGIRDARAAQAPACILDMPLLYEAGLETLCDQVWCAWLPQKTQLERLMARDRLSPADAQARLDSQLPVDEKAARADVVIDTSGSIQYTKEYILQLYAREIGTMQD